MEQTLSIIKPDAVAQNKIGEIIARFEKEGIKIVGAKMIHLNDQEARAFYSIHSEKPFFEDLVSFMSSGPIMVMVLEGENVIQKNRAIMGATDPKNAEANTLRALYGTSIDNNAVHGSDSPETAKGEIAFFFKKEAILPR